MKTVTLDLTNIHTPRGMHVYIAYMMNFPPHYGRNLDALFDMLTQLDERTQLIIRRPSVLPPELSALFPRLCLVLHDAQAENSRLQVVIEPTC